MQKTLKNLRKIKVSQGFKGSGPLQNDPALSPICGFLGLEIGLKNCPNLLKLVFLSVFGPHVGTKMAPWSPQETLRNAFVLFLDRFWSDVGPIFSDLGPMFDQFGNHFPIHFWLICLLVCWLISLLACWTVVVLLC